MSNNVNRKFRLSGVPRRVTINLETVDLVAEGFSRKRAQKWAKKAYRVKHEKNGMISSSQVNSALEKGFFPEELMALEAVNAEYSRLITSKEYEFLGALNERAGLRISNQLNTYKTLVHCRKNMPKHFFKVIYRNNRRTVEAFSGDKDLCTFVDIIETLQEEGTLRLRRVRGTTSSLLEYKDGCFFLDGMAETKESIVQKLSSYKFSYIVTEAVKERPAFEGAKLSVMVVNEPESKPIIGNATMVYSLKTESEKAFPAVGVESESESESEIAADVLVDAEEAFGKYFAPVDLIHGKIGDAICVKNGQVVSLKENPNTKLNLENTLPGYEVITDIAKKVCQQVPELRFFGLEFAVAETKCVLMRLINHPKYPVTVPLEETISEYLRAKVELKKAEFADREVRKARKAEYIKWKLRKRALRREAGGKMRLGDRIEKYRIYAAALNLVSKGFANREAKKWAKGTYQLKHKQDVYSKAEVQRALKKGFMPAQLQHLETAGALYDELISAKDYAYLCPINGGYSKWITDRITINAIFKPYRNVMPKCYYQIYKRDAETAIIPLYDFEAGRSFDDIINMVMEKGSLRVRVSHGNKSNLLAYVNGSLYYGTKKVTREKLIEILSSYQSTLVVTENVLPSAVFNGARLRLTVFNEQGDNPMIGDAVMRYYAEDVDDDYILSGEDSTAEDDAYEVETVEEDSKEEDNDEDQDLDIDEFRAKVDPVTGKISKDVVLLNGNRAVKDANPSNGLPLAECVPCWNEIVETIDSMCRFVPQLEYFGIDIIITDDGFKIMKMTNHPEYPTSIPFSAETSAYLKRKFQQKKEAYGKMGIRVQRALKKMKLMIRAKYAKTFFPKGLKPYLSIRIFQDLKKDFLTNRDTTLKQKIWAAKHGFISYRIPQYGITEENHKNYISDFEYKWLRHINNKYRVWMEDKITVKYICSEYNSCFPEYYYHISLKNGSNRIIPMMDCPKELGNAFEDIVKLVHEKGALALKPDEGSHGDGFYKFSYEDGKYFLNHEEASLADVQRILDDVNNQYLVTEYINMHHEIKRIYDGAVNTIRMIVFKKDGVTPVIGNAYMRFGSKRTGAVDNMGAGGMFAKIDIDTGRFYDAKIIEANEIKPCLHHPDTGVMIDGYLPNWEKVKADVINVAKNIPQLEYFGFDLALTEDGLKFPEINRFPDYPAIEKYTPETIDYLLYKLEQRKKKYGYDVSRGNTLVKLPKR